ncbi:class A beta-lactamase-related serine hydrolase [Patescibacteria group bacterium]|nr:class A beta-lactamase-related serine hydrolase [Patescibacteria group bacterium]
MNYKLLLIGGMLVGFIAGGASVWVYTGGTSAETYIPPLRLKGQYALVSPILACQAPNYNSTPENRSLEQKLQAVIDSDKSAGKASEASVYAIQFNTGIWAGVHENELYAPASMNKVPLLIAYLELAHEQPSILRKEVLYSGPRAGTTNDEETVALMVPGKTYTIQDLLYRLIVYSDNDAKDYLHDFINQQLVDYVYSDFGLPVPDVHDTGDSLSPKQYSFFFRTLYNSTYLDPEMSELALELLSKTTFTQGLVAGVATSDMATTTVAHKFGLRVFPSPQTDQNNITQELSDCGIVYTSPNPYFICVMTKGWNTVDLESTIADVSRAAYQYFAQ